VAANTSFIAPSATMTIHPIRMTGLVLGVQQSFDYLERMQSRVINFMTSHSKITAAKFRELMMETGELAHDVGTIVVGEDAVKYGLIDRVGGLGEALAWLREEIAKRKVEDGVEGEHDYEGDDKKAGRVCRPRRIAKSDNDVVDSVEDNNDGEVDNDSAGDKGDKGENVKTSTPAKSIRNGKSSKNNAGNKGRKGTKKVEQ
jgi:hypothetical protein